MEPANYVYQSEFAKRIFGKGVTAGIRKGRAEGRTEGKAEGKAEVVLKQLKLRFGELAARDVKRVLSAPLADLDRYAERLLTAETLAEVWKQTARKPRKTARTQNQSR